MGWKGRGRGVLRRVQRCAVERMREGEIGARQVFEGAVEAMHETPRRWRESKLYA